MAIKISLIYLVTESCSGTWFLFFLIVTFYLFIYCVPNIYWIGFSRKTLMSFSLTIYLPSPPKRFFITCHNSLWIRARFRLKSALIVGCLRSSPDAELFMSRTQYIELSTWKVRRLNQLGTPVSIWNGLSRCFCLARPGISPLERLWNGLIQTPNFSCTEPNTWIIITYFVCSLTD